MTKVKFRILFQRQMASVFVFLGLLLGQGLFFLPFLLPSDSYSGQDRFGGSSPNAHFGHRDSERALSAYRKWEGKKRKALLKRIESVFREHLKGLPSETAIAESRRVTGKDSSGIESKRLERPNFPLLARVFLEECERFHFEPELILAVIEVESNFHVAARSHRGATGLMQLQPRTALDVLQRQKSHPSVKRDLAGVDLTDPELNMRLGIQYLGYLKGRVQARSPFDLFAAYLVGPEKYGQIKSRPGYRPSETLRYFNKIQQRKEEWRNRL
jgi:hypothetical protein